MTLRLPRVSPDLPDWQPEVLATWAAHEASARSIVSSVGVGRHFDTLVAQAAALLESHDEEAITRRLTERRFPLAVATAWAEDRDLAERTMSSRLVSLFGTPEVCVSRFTTIALARLLVGYFEMLDSWDEQLFDALSASTEAAVRLQPRRMSDVVETFRNEGAFLLHRTGPRTLARRLKDTGAGVAEWLADHDLADGGSFRHAVVEARYLTDIDDADATREDHPFLTEVTTAATAHLRAGGSATDRRRFGHDVLDAMLAKDVLRPSATWLKAILTIAGDPRHRGTPTWDLWWARLDPRYLDRALRWMSGADLRTFLQAVEHYGRSSGKTDLTRMLAPRRRVLDDLFESGRIRETRLILGADVAHSIAGRAVLSDYDAARYVEIGAADKALVVVDCGDFTLVEGSHNFKLFVLVGRPPEALLDRRKRHFTLDDIRYRLTAEHDRLHGSGHWDAFAHNGDWQGKARAFLRSHRIRVDARVFAP